MLFLFIDQYDYKQPPKSSGGANLRKHVTPQTPCRLRRLFCFYYLGQECLREKKLIGGLEIPSYCTLFLSHKYPLCSADLCLPIRGQFAYHQSFSPCKPLHLNGGCRFLQVLCPRCTFLDFIFAFTHQEIKPKGGKPVNLNRPMARGG